MKSKSDICRMVERNGGRIKQGSKHVKVYDPAGILVGILPSGRKVEDRGCGYRNFRSRLRSAGLWED